jgi:hypothetical protein
MSPGSLRGPFFVASPFRYRIGGLFRAIRAAILNNRSVDPSSPRKSRVDERGYGARLGEQLVQQLHSLPTQFRVQRGHSGEVAPRSVQAGNETDLNRIGASNEDNGNRRGCSPCCYRRLAVRGNHGYPAANQIGRQSRKTIVVTSRPAIFDRHGLVLDIAGLAQAVAKRGQKVCSRRYVPARATSLPRRSRSAVLMGKEHEVRRPAVGRGMLAEPTGAWHAGLPPQPPAKDCRASYVRTRGSSTRLYRWMAADALSSQAHQLLCFAASPPRPSA